MIITIDGPSGTGKSTVAKKLAQQLGFTFFDTGAMYRAITWSILQKHIALNDASAIEAFLEDFHFRIEETEGKKRYFVDLDDVTEEIRTRGITAKVSTVSAIASVRKKVSSIQKQLAVSSDAIFEGRDMGSVVFPNADLKIFLTARPEIRADRRFKEFAEKGTAYTHKEILHDILSRDEADSTRKISPLIKPKDAIEIDTSDLTVDEVVEEILALVPKNLY